MNILKNSFSIKNNLNWRINDFVSKKRYSFITTDKLFQIDLTIVKQSDGFSFISSKLIDTENVNYEIELEYIGNKFTKNASDSDKKNKVDFVKLQLRKNIGYILQVIEDSFFVITDNEKKLVQDVYHKLLLSILEKRKTKKIETIQSLTRIFKKAKWF